MSNKNFGEEGGYGFIRPEARSSSDYNYKCPKCGGEFRTWDRDVLGTGDSNPKCPFCGLEKGGYGGAL